MKDFKIKIEHPKLLSEDIAESIKTAIIKGKFKPGEKISEGELAESMGISRTPLREAFRKLENEGFIEIIPRKGAVVTEIDPNEAFELYLIKSTLEGLAARLATRRIQDKDIQKLVKINTELKKLIDDNELETFYQTHCRFHEVFIKVSGNDRLIQIISNLNDHFQRLGIVSLTLPGRYKSAIRQHEEIIDAFKRGDEMTVERVVRENVMTGGRVLIDHLGQARGKDDPERIG
jgi:DNA-binding GntR family transcriptional regulator